MDSVTQAVLGGTAALVITRGKEPRKAVMWGAAIATLPDLDVFIPYDNALERLVSHRTWTHSWLVQTAISPVLAFILQRTVPAWHFKTWLLMVWVVLTTHSGLDACTVFGTDLFWPLAKSTIVGGSVFIIDPLYTIFLLIACVLALARPQSKTLWRNGVILLMISSVYLVWGLVAKTTIHSQAVTALSKQGISTDKVLVHATPFNTLLWRILVIDGDYYYEGYRSVFDKEDIVYTKHERHPALLKGLEETLAVHQLRHFNHDYFSVRRENEALIVTDLRMGAEPVYSFQFKIAEFKGEKIESVTAETLHRPAIPQGFFSSIWKRIFSEK